MAPQGKSVLWAAIAATLFVGLFGYWYSWGASKLTSSEVDYYMSAIEEHPSIFQTAKDLADFRGFLETDDGHPFYTVNFYRYYADANYTDAQAGNVSGRQAFDKFSSVMVPLLLKRASHPIFGSDWIDRYNDDWHRMVIVRYRSRRDMADIFASPEFANAVTDKWAGIEVNQRQLVQALHIPSLFFPVITLLLIVVGFMVSVKLLKRSDRPFSKLS